MTGDRDPTRMRNQPALTTSSGTSWVVVGAIILAASLVTLVPFAAGPLPGVPVVVLVVLAGLFVAVIVVRARIDDARRRNRLLATLVLTMAGLALVTMAIIAAVVWQQFVAASGA